MNNDEFPKLIFDTPFDERSQFEAKAKGYLGCAKVMLENGNKYPVIFYDNTRLGQDLEYEVSSGCGFIADLGMIVLAEVTIENMSKAVRTLAKEGYFQGLTPM